MKQIAFALMLALTGPAYAADPVYNYATGDAEMDAAMMAARGTLKAFLAHQLEADGTGKDGTMIKVGVPPLSGDVSLEHVWVSPFKRMSPGVFRGVLANEPVYDLGVKYGQMFEFSADQITDWAFYSTDGDFYGGYTVRVVAAQHPEAGEGIAFSATPTPADWK